MNRSQLYTLLSELDANLQKTLAGEILIRLGDSPEPKHERETASIPQPSEYAAHAIIESVAALLAPPTTERTPTTVSRSEALKPEAQLTKLAMHPDRTWGSATDAAGSVDDSGSDYLTLRRNPFARESDLSVISGSGVEPASVAQTVEPAKILEPVPRSEPGFNMREVSEYFERDSRRYDRAL